jgi:hypothetical protein
MTNIVVTNQSTTVSDGDVQTMTRAVAAQVKLHAAPLWAIEPVPVTYLPKESLQTAPPGSWVIAVLDDPDQADALGWHTEQQGGVVYGRVFARPVLDNGGDALTKQLSVASVLSHEVLETFVDPHVNLWADAGNGTAYSYEVCDPVESDSYAIDIDSTNVTVSDFVTPHWFDPQAGASATLDYLGKCTHPFQLTHGGYVVILKEGKPTQKFGEAYPAWRKATKRADTSRFARRLARRGIDAQDLLPAT